MGKKGGQKIHRSHTGAARKGPEVQSGRRGSLFPRGGRVAKNASKKRGPRALEKGRSRGEDGEIQSDLREGGKERLVVK